MRRNFDIYIKMAFLDIGERVEICFYLEKHRHEHAYRQNTAGKKPDDELLPQQ